MLQQGIPLPKDTARAAETILINILPHEMRVAVLEGEEVCELHFERASHRGLVGNVYLGVVKRVLPGMQSAFIDIGLERSAFLHVVDLFDNRRDLETNLRIETVLYEGQRILVQVIKDPISSKGARLSTQISLAGRFLVHLPQDNHIGVSQRIENEEERELLRNKLKQLLPEDASHGYIIRTSAENASEQELAGDVAYLSKLWEHIQYLSKTQAPESIIYQDLSLELRVLRDMFHPDTKKILIDNQDAYKRMKAFAQQFVDDACDKIELYHNELALFEAYPIEKAINSALNAKVNLKGGGYLIIEQTEAMTTIDVNTGGFVGGNNFDETIFKTNLEACHSAAREMRLRNLGGIIIIDFIDMENEQHRDAVLQKLAEELSLDKTKVTLNGFTNLGLVELTRKRARESLIHLLCESCSVCQGKGYHKTAQTVCYEIVRELLKIDKISEVETYRILAAPTVIEMLIDEESDLLTALSKKMNKTISLAVESVYSQEQFDIVLVQKARREKDES